MKTYLPYYYKKIGIAFVVIAIIISFIAGIDDFLNGYVEGYNSTQTTKAEMMSTMGDIISHNASKVLIWISLFFSFSGFLLYMLSKEKIEDELVQHLRFKSLASSLLFTWIIVAILIIINGDIRLEGLYILQFQLFAYVVIYNYYKKYKFN